MKTFKTFIAERVKGIGWQKDSWSYMFGYNRFLPLAPSFQRQVPGKYQVAFHLTSPTNAERIVKLQKRPSAQISVTTDFKPRMVRQFFPISGDAGEESGYSKDQHGMGVALKLKGKIVAGGPGDIMSQPDENGYRWVDPASFAEFLGDDAWEFKQELKRDLYRVSMYAVVENMDSIMDDIFKIVDEKNTDPDYPSKYTQNAQRLFGWFTSRDERIKEWQEDPMEFMDWVEETLEMYLRDVDAEPSPSTWEPIQKFLMMARGQGILSGKTKQKMFKSYFENMEKVIKKNRQKLIGFVHSNNKHEYSSYDEHIMDHFQIVSILPGNVQTVQYISDKLHPGMLNLLPDDLHMEESFDEDGLISEQYIIKWKKNEL